MFADLTMEHQAPFAIPAFFRAPEFAADGGPSCTPAGVPHPPLQRALQLHGDGRHGAVPRLHGAQHGGGHRKALGPRSANVNGIAEKVAAAHSSLHPGKEVSMIRLFPGSGEPGALPAPEPAA
jgi:hypothetical protein